MRLALLGSTGSIGEQTLDVVRAHPKEFEVRVLTALHNWERLSEQAIEFNADTVVIGDMTHYAQLKKRLAPYPIKVYAGAEAIAQVAAGGDTDTVVNALVGAAGLLPSLATVKAGKRLALANKESLVVGGALLIDEALQNRAPLIPIDSEHSAILQCLVGEPSPIRRLVITASGGAFRDTPSEELATVKAADALRHPTWTMGAKITVDSATMFNKGFEVIEAHWLFGVEPERIEVVLHPQSIIHSMVEFEDGAVKAQLGIPDMRLPIQYSLTVPERKLLGSYFDFSTMHTLNFLPVDFKRYPALELCYDALRRGGTAPATVNAANEVAVAAFLAGQISFPNIVRTVERTLLQADWQANPTLNDLLAADRLAREIAVQQNSVN